MNEMNQILRQVERATSELSLARGRLNDVMGDVRSLPPGLKTVVCDALEGAVERVQAAELHLTEVNELARVDEVRRSTLPPGPASAAVDLSSLAPAADGAAAAPAAPAPTPRPAEGRFAEHHGLLMFGAMLAGVVIARLATGP